MENEPLHSDNRAAIIEILDELRAQAERDELLQLFVVTEQGSGFSSLWSGSEDRFGISGFVLASALTRMGFLRPPEQA